jgi:hypothetical protein
MGIIEKPQHEEEQEYRPIAEPVTLPGSWEPAELPPGRLPHEEPEKVPV